MADSASPSDIPAWSNRNTCESSFPRYVLVNDANLKSQTYCKECGTEIGQRYVRP
jgi:predicted Zn-dependent protease